MNNFLVVGYWLLVVGGGVLTTNPALRDFALLNN
jgi:hypothetical protein